MAKSNYYCQKFAHLHGHVFKPILIGRNHFIHFSNDLIDSKFFFGILKELIGRIHPQCI